MVFFLLWLFPGFSWAQYNDSVHYYTGVASTGSYNKTNTSRAYLFSNTVKLGIRKEAISLNATNSWVYGQQQRNTTNNDVGSVLDFNVYKLGKHAYYWGLASYMSSLSLKVNNQYQAGAGVAFNILDGKDLHLNVSDGFIYDNVDLYLKDTIRDVYSTGRNSFRLMFRCHKGVFTFNGTGFLQNSLWRSSDYIVKVNASIGVKINKWLSFTTACTFNRFNRTGKENTLLTFGLTIDKYF